MDDSRTLTELAQEALDIQNTCNLSGLVHGWSRSMKRLRELVKMDTDSCNQHPINVMWADKVSSLAGCQYGGYYSEKFMECERLAAGQVPAVAISDPPVVNDLPF